MAISPESTTGARAGFGPGGRRVATPVGHLGTRDAGPVRRARAGVNGSNRAGWTADAGIRAVTAHGGRTPRQHRPRTKGVARCRHRLNSNRARAIRRPARHPHRERRATRRRRIPTPRAAPPDETDRLTTAFARAMHNQAQDLDGLSRTFEPPPTRMVVFEDVQGQRARAEAEKRAEVLRAESRAPRPRDGRDLLQPGDIPLPCCKRPSTATSPVRVRAQVVGERFRTRCCWGRFATFPPVVGSRPERVQVAFNVLTTPDRQTHAIRAYAIDTESARTALATGVDHHTLERWGSLLASSFLEGYGKAVRNSNSIRRSLHSAASSPCRRTGSITATSRARPWGPSVSG